MQKFWCYIVALALLCGCSSFEQSRTMSCAWMSNNKKIKVLCTTPFISDFVREIGGDDVDVLELMPRNHDPHSYQLVRGDRDVCRRADYIFCSGLNLEHNQQFMHCICARPHCCIANCIEAKVHRTISIGDTKDPHVWLDCNMWAEAPSIIAEHLSHVCPDKQQVFMQRAALTTKRLLELDTYIFTLLQSVPEQKRYLITAHEALLYFCRAYLATHQEREDGTWIVRAAAPEGNSDLDQISTADIQRVVAYTHTHDITTLFSEYDTNNDSLITIANIYAQTYGKDVHIWPDPLYSDTMKPADTYETMMLHNCHTIYHALTGIHP